MNKKLSEINTEPGMLIPIKVHKISAQFPSPVKAKINISKKGNVAKRYSISGAQLGTRSAGRLCK